MKKGRIIALIAAVAVLLSVPATMVGIGFGAPAVFGDTYYGELSEMLGKLRKTEGKKIVFLGNSSVAFGVNSDLIASEIPDYEIVNFGLYGAIGTKTMLDLSRPSIREGDIVILLVEPYQQTSSLYYSGSEIWRAADSDKSILNSLPGEYNGSMVGAFPGYVAEKVKYSTSPIPMNTGIYKRDSFKKEDGQYADYIVADRPYNVMAGGYDKANRPILSKEVFGAGFLDYLNEYAAFAKDKKASVLYGFCPVNSLSVDGEKEQTADECYDYLSQTLKFPTLGHPEAYFFDYRCFYDNNVHLNSTGMNYYANALVDDLKLHLGITSENNIPLPALPEVPFEPSEQGDDSDLDKFTCDIVDGELERYARITGLTEEGKAATALIVPSTYEGLPIREFDASVFQNDTAVSRIVLPKNIHTIYDHSFLGATRLSELYFEHDSILGINVGYDFLEGADSCYIYLKSTVSIAGCAGGWERYERRIRFY